MNKIIISGIQQIGVGIKEIYSAWKWYKDVLGYDVKIFDEAAVAELMLPYTAGTPKERHAALAMNLQGGGGFEIWQHTQHESKGPDFQLQAGDLGIYITKIKAKNAGNALKVFKHKNIKIIGELLKDPNGTEYFFIEDPYGNIFQIIEGDDSWFKDEGKPTGGTYGCIIGSSDINKALPLYQQILQYDKVVYDKTGQFEDLKSLPGGDKTFRRVLLTHSQPRKGAFSPIFGNTCIELIQVTDREPVKIFKDRLWGEFGFIHLCFDIQGMDALRKQCKEMGYPFTVDTGNSFDMGEAAGAFAYIEDQDGTLIEFVETHKVPLLKKFGIYLNLQKRNPEKPLPRWMLNMLGISRVKL